MDFPSHKDRLKKVVLSALEGCAYESSRSPEEGVFVIAARRPSGKPVEVHFRGVKDAAATGEPPVGSRLGLGSVGDPGRFSLLRFLLPAFLRTPPDSARVRIMAGDQQIDIVCQDAEWYEDSA
jgi:hypothetical protein